MWCFPVAEIASFILYVEKANKIDQQGGIFDARCYRIVKPALDVTIEYSFAHFSCQNDQQEEEAKRRQSQLLEETAAMALCSMPTLSSRGRCRRPREKPS